MIPTAGHGSAAPNDDKGLGATMERIRVRAEISSQILRVEAPAWQGAKVQEYLDIPSFRNAARRDASACIM